MNLGPYTKAKNCTDAADCRVGIAEIKEYLKDPKNPTKLAYRRFAKLDEKLKKYENIQR